MPWGWIIAIAVVVIVLFWYVTTYNRFIGLRNKMEEAFSTMDVYLKRRYDLVPNLVETVKGYAKHEAGTLEAVVKARNAAASAPTMAERAQGENQLTGTLRSLFALAESYPDLKANQGFQQLQSELSSIEEDILNARKYYNGVVRDLNTQRESFPSNLVAGAMHLDKGTLFEIDAPQRENVKVQF